MTDFDKAKELIDKSRYILIVTHINPDPDTISSALSISNYFAKNKIKHQLFNKSKQLPKNLDFLTRFDKFHYQLPKFYDLIISVDCGSIDRFGFEIDKNIPIINIDHHQSNNNFGIINFVDSNISSASEIVFRFLKGIKAELSKEICECLYTGIYDDSIAFSTPRVDKTTFDIISELLEYKIDIGYISDNLLRRESLAKYRLIPKILDTLELSNEGKVGIIVLKNGWLKPTGANMSDGDDCVNMILNISIIEIAIYIKEIRDGYRISLRSKNSIDISQIAIDFGGGGHKMAAGCTIKNDTLEGVKIKLLEKIDEKKE